MLASLGLGKLEAGLMRHTLQPSEVADFLDQASPSDMKRLARDGMPSAIEGLHRRQLQRIEPSLEAVYQATAHTYSQPLSRTGESGSRLRGNGPSLREEGVPSMRSRHSVVDSLRAGGAAV
ncbi:hypothetical protein AWB85_12050 [Mycobacteroides immunogenum]|uniref:Uncharacterized protein n=1 Tax=Mycobacteroides immunogenum TaxID=83262 RepID=A0A179V7M0_9MYCO|nr:hypothetical protein [Mycobacteroides immunogenum]OAT67918.1 hypothetical protein AWB85_12050 [Mycobacteroides immunogenum]